MENMLPEQLVMAVILVVAGCVGAYVAMLRTRSKNPAAKPLPSPPTKLPKWVGKLGGHMLLLKKGKMAQQLEEWADGFGGAYELFLFGTRRILVVDPAESRRILSRRPAGFGRGPSSTDIQSAGRAVGMCPGLFTEEGAAWRRSRRLLAPAFSAHNTRTMVPAIAKIARTLVEKWSAAADGDGIVDAKDDLGRFAHDVIALVGFRHEAKAVTATDENPCLTFEALSKMFTNYHALSVSPFLWFAYNWIPSHPWVKALAKDKEAVKTLVQNLCENERQLVELEKGGVENNSSVSSARTDSKEASAEARKPEASEGLVLRKLVQAGDDGITVGGGGGGGGGGKRVAMPDDEIVTQARSLFLAGQETTSLALAWCVYFLAKHPHVLARCRKEVAEHIKSSDGMVTSFDETTNLVYLSAVYKETLRVKDTVPTLNFWAKEEHTMLNGSTYPPGTAFTLLMRYMNTREEHFTRAKEFIPERWIESEREEALLGKVDGVKAAQQARVVNHAEEAYFPFGGGPRVCPGQGISRLEVLVLLAALCVQFDISLAPGQADPPEDESAITSGPEDMRLRVTKRTVGLVE